jgi:ATP-binding cassette subfamily B (MDR/TAP) protein 1
VPSIDIESKSGEEPKQIIGDIKFQNVSFRYPSRQQVQILHNLDLHIDAGKTVALVGSSGCGNFFFFFFVEKH